MLKRYPLFKRLAFFAATMEDVVPANQALSWLIDDGNWWLWSIETQRETIRLLVSLVSSLDKRGMSELEGAVLRGPQRDLYRGDVSEDLWIRIVEGDIWLRLAKMADAGAKLGDDARRKLDELTRLHPDWQLAADQRDEFAFWLSSREEVLEYSIPPQEQDELTKWLTQDFREVQWRVKDWQERCRKDFSTVVNALIGLAGEGCYPEDHWRTALIVWIEDDILEHSWRRLAKFLAEAPGVFIQAIAHELIIWLMEQAKVFVGQKELFFLLSGRILEMEHQSSGLYDDNLVARAYNDPVGSVTEAIMRWWYRHCLQDGEGLLDDIESLLVDLCDTRGEKYRPGRVILAITWFLSIEWIRVGQLNTSCHCSTGRTARLRRVLCGKDFYFHPVFTGHYWRISRSHF